MTEPANLLGQRFGRLVVIDSAAPVPRGKKMAARWQCRCDCGTVRAFRAEDLKSGNSKSCGCGQRDKARSRFLEHGQSKTPLYKTWCKMKARCRNPNDPKFPIYGGRGIDICDRWSGSFEAFVADMGPRPLGGSIDRIDNDKGYEPSNCRWSTPKEQSRNKRNNIWVEHEGQMITASDYADVCGISSKSLYKVISRGLEPKAAAEYVKAHRRTR